MMLTAKGDDETASSARDGAPTTIWPSPSTRVSWWPVSMPCFGASRSRLPGAPSVDEEVVAFGRVEVNLGTRTLSRDGEEQALTTGEFSLLKVLLQHPRQPLSRDKLMEMARGREYEVSDRAIDVQVSRLRKLVEEDP